MSNIQPRANAGWPIARDMFNAGASVDQVAAALPHLKRSTLRYYLCMCRKAAGLTRPSEWQRKQSADIDPLLQ